MKFLMMGVFNEIRERLILMNDNDITSKMKELANTLAPKSTPAEKWSDSDRFKRVISGTSEFDVMSSGSMDSVVRAWGGADLIVNGSGNDLIDGGKGNDTVIFDRPREDYEIKNHKNGWKTVINKETGEIDKLKNVEHLHFNDIPRPPPPSWR